MSMLNPAASGKSTEVGETVVTVREYEAAQKTVSQLIAAEVPARDIAIVGAGVRTVERVTGRLGYATAARSGAMNGLLIGIFLSALFVLGNPEGSVQVFIGVLSVGVAMGMILSLTTYAILRRRRDFASVMQMVADHYDVTVMPASLAKARQVLGRTPAPAPPVISTEPPRYGERVAPGDARPHAGGAGEQPTVPVTSAVPPVDPAAAPPRYGERVVPPAATASPETASPASPETAAQDPETPESRPAD